MINEGIVRFLRLSSLSPVGDNCPKLERLTEINSRIYLLFLQLPILSRFETRFWKFPDREFPALASALAPVFVQFFYAIF
jgi:hypothetical protein